ncbi:MAG: type IV secretory system conjugative DNA transfer family protein [Bacilli bacterium]|nr:type IV secretory system conjugative DNA transfer family protein [Bacilli bacterium]
MKESIQEILDKKENIFIFDSSLKYYNYYGKQLKDLGYETKIVNLENPLLSDGWNPIDYIRYLYDNNEQGLLIDSIEYFAEEIFVKENPKNDPYWIDSARSLFIGSTLLLLKAYEKEIYKKPLDLNSLETVISSASIKVNNKSGLTSSFLRNQVNKLERKNIIRRLLSPIVDAPSETRSSVISVTLQKLNMYLYREDFSKSMSNAKFKVEDINKDKTAIFVVGKKSLNPLVNVLLNQVITHTNKNNYKINVILDSFDTLPINSNINDIITNSNLLISVSDNNYLDYYKGINLKKYLKESNIVCNKTYPIKELEIVEEEYFDYPVFVLKSLMIDKN